MIVPLRNDERVTWVTFAEEIFMLTFAHDISIIVRDCASRMLFFS